MFHSQASIGLALLPVAWAAREQASRDPSPNDQAATIRAGSGARADFDRHFPAGWSRETVPDLPAAAASGLARVKSRWQSSTLAAWLRRWRFIFAGVPRTPA
jgi:hypothetical protein